MFESPNIEKLTRYEDIDCASFQLFLSIWFKATDSAVSAAIQL